MNEIEKPLKSANMHDVVQEWYAKFVEVQQETLFELILAANYMDIKPLLDLTCATVASMIKVQVLFSFCRRSLWFACAFETEALHTTLPMSQALFGRLPPLHRITARCSSLEG